jgi:hypothetical protein
MIGVQGSEEFPGELENCSSVIVNGGCYSLVAEARG